MRRRAQTPAYGCRRRTSVDTRGDGGDGGGDGGDGGDGESVESTTC